MPLDRKKVAMGWRRLRVMIQHACLLGTFGFFLCGVPSCQSLERAPSNEGLTISSSEVFHFILFFIVRSQQNLEWIFFLFLLSSLLLGAMAFYELPWRTEKFYVSNFQRKDKKKVWKFAFEATTDTSQCSLTSSGCSKGILRYFWQDYTWVDLEIKSGDSPEHWDYGHVISWCHCWVWIDPKEMKSTYKRDTCVPWRCLLVEKWT